MILEDCPECGSYPRCFWKEVYIRDVLPDETVNNIPVQKYIVECSNLLCSVCVTLIFPYRAFQTEQSLIDLWNSLPKTFLENK